MPVALSQWLLHLTQDVLQFRAWLLNHRLSKHLISIPPSLRVIIYRARRMRRWCSWNMAITNARIA